MENHYVLNKNFEKENNLKKGDYEACNFVNCNFYEQDFSNFKFIDCTFNNCNISLVKLNKTALLDVAFIDCKMLGLRFDTCSNFALSFSFDNCELNCSSFYQLKLKNTIYKNCDLKEVDFTETDLTNTLFHKCNLSKAVFINTILEKANLCSSYNFSINPENNRIKKAKFSTNNICGLLDKYEIIIE